jgi:hypothetical protein
VRITSDLDRSISEVMEYHSTEFNYWSVVFQEEYYETHPNERYKDGMSNEDCAKRLRNLEEL